MEATNLQNILDAGVYHPSTTEKNYGIYLKKFALFVKANEHFIGDMKTMIPKNHFNDQTLACFFYELGRLHEYKPHIKKSCLAAINFGLQIHRLENIHSFKHIYPDLTLILKQWD
jgi:hypothetical protein